MGGFFDFLDTLLFVILVAFIASLVFIAYASKQAPGNPLRIAMGAISARIAATVGVAILDIPITVVEPIGGFIDIGTMMLLAYYWWTAIRQIRHAFVQPESPPAPHPAEPDQVALPEHRPLAKRLTSRMS